MSPAASEPERTLDLDAARAARREKQGPPPGIRIAGERVEIPSSIPIGILDAFDFDPETEEIRLGPGDVVRLLSTLTGPEAWKRLVDAGLDLEDLGDLIDGILELYGLRLGESKASPDSSGDTSGPSRPTSDAGTVLTLPPPSTVKDATDAAIRRRRPSPSVSSGT